jgi:hypothetical protein
MLIGLGREEHRETTIQDKVWLWAGKAAARRT